MTKKDRTRAVTPEVSEAIGRARTAGLSERAIYEGLREGLKEPPSYRDVRAVLERRGLRYKTQATQRRADDLAARVADGRKFFHKGPNDPTFDSYRQRKTVALSVDFTSDAGEKFDRRYLLGYLARAGIDPDAIEDEGFRQSLESIYQGEGS